jgi:hypothetical protein
MSDTWPIPASESFSNEGLYDQIAHWRKEYLEMQVWEKEFLPKAQGPKDE